MEAEFDTIIIGSGAGGLAAALCLAKEGQKVLVLEQHDVPGGWCHSFYLKGHRFTPGVHYIGLLGKGLSSSDLYSGLGVANDLVFFRMNPAAYEHCWIGEKRFDLPAGHSELIESLSARFPKEKKGIKKYLTTVRGVSRQLQLIPKMSGFWDNITIPYRTRHMGKYGLFSLRRVIGWHVKDPVLKQVLNIQCGDHGLPPAKASFPLHCAVMDHYFEGASYPMGGGGAIVKAMTSAIKRHGGEVRTKQRVKRILIAGDEKKRATGIEFENGEKIFAKRIISNADPNKTYLELVGKENISAKLAKKLRKTKYSCSSLMLFLIVDLDVRAAGLDSGNVWVMPEKDTDEIYEEMYAEDLTVGEYFNGLFLSCTTLKDPTSFDGKHHALEAITFIDPKGFEKFNGTDAYQTEEYEKFKALLTEKMLSTVELVLPEIRDHVVMKELGTPKTNEYYINSTNGSVYGTEKSFMQTGPFSYKAKSEIENLYLCGASIVSHGVVGASYSGVQTAASILGCKQDDLIQPDETQNVLIYEAEDDSDYPDWMLQKMKVKRDRAASNALVADNIDQEA